MKILNFGSLNIDLVYQVPHFVRAGETIASTAFTRNVGGKGLNQSVAFAKAGVEIYHAGLIGTDGEFLREFLQENSVNTKFVHTVDAPSGNALIQVEESGDNCIVLFGGANQCVSEPFIAEVLEDFEANDFLILQNEINNLPRIIELAHAKGMQVVLNPSPIDDSLKLLPFDKVGWLILNTVEGCELSGETQPDKILDALLEKYPNTRIVLTLGGDGSVYADLHKRVRQSAFSVDAVDTTAAGDTFTGYFFASVAAGLPVEQALLRASKASAISVTRPGAAASIPMLQEVLEVLGQ